MVIESFMWFYIASAGLNLIFIAYDYFFRMDSIKRVFDESLLPNDVLET